MSNNKNGWPLCQRHVSGLPTQLLDYANVCVNGKFFHSEILGDICRYFSGRKEQSFHRTTFKVKLKPKTASKSTQPFPRLSGLNNFKFWLKIRPCLRLARKLVIESPWSRKSHHWFTVLSLKGFWHNFFPGLVGKIKLFKLYSPSRFASKISFVVYWTSCWFSSERRASVALPIPRRLPMFITTTVFTTKPILRGASEARDSRKVVRVLETYLEDQLRYRCGVLQSIRNP